MPNHRILSVFTFVTGDEQNGHNRRKRQSDKDVTTVLLVDSHGRSSLGRYQNVKPNIGLITSTARTFVQDGVATEYATQVLGTTLDNGRVYAHLLSKSSKVLNDKAPNKQWNVKDASNEYLKNVDSIAPNKAGGAVYVFPTRMPYYPPVENNRQEVTVGMESLEEEILKEAPSNNFRSAYLDPGKIQNNVKVFKISPQVKDLTYENIINHKETTDAPLKKEFTPSKVKPWDNVPTFTVRNEFSPSGLSYLGDLPDFEEKTERSKLTTPAERKAKLLFRAGLAKPNPKDLKSITYTGFADFTTTVGDTVIFFTPHTSDVKKPEPPAEATKISVEATIKPTSVFEEPTMTKAILPPKSKEPAETKTFLPSMVIDKTDRVRESKTIVDEHIDMDAKSAVLAHEQGKETTINRFSPDVIQPSETQPVLLSTPSDEDIAKIFASLQAQAMQVTQPLQFAPKEETKEPSLTGATTIFFDDDLPIETSAVEASGATAVGEPTTEAEIHQETTEKQQTTTEEILTTSDNIISTFPIQQTTPEIKETEAEDDEQDDEDVEATCTRVLVPTTIYKTLTYLTTFYIPIEGGTSTSIRSNEVINTETGYETKPCGYLSPATVSSELKISPSILQQPVETEKTNNVETTTVEQQTTTQEEQEVTEQRITTVAQEVTTEEHQVTESEPETTEATTDEGEEVELIFKTLYTTYTYLTTYFQDTTSSIASRIVVTTNVITSTLDPNREITDEAVAGLMGKVESPVSKTVSFDDLADINPSNVESVVPTRSVDPDTEDSEESEDADASKATPTLDDKKVLETGAEGLKTYYTTYTYFTTIFVDGETEISSRTEVYTNYVTPSQVTPGDKDIIPTKVPDDERKEKILKLNSYNTINRHKDADSNEILSTPSSKEQGYVTLQRGSTTTEDNEIEDENNILDLSEYETIATMVTDVRSSTSAGDRRIIDNLDKRNVLLDDQTVSESNNESEIIPSPTLLLQTSYTTFTYFTTMYHGTTSSDIVSRLETITNVVTQTLSPTQRITPEDVSLPVTYFTTFTYWTTLYKDGTTKVTSREETVSNVVTPTIEATSVAPPIIATEVPEISSTKAVDESIVPSTVGDDDLTTYFTTYTYYTTSYIGDQTVLNSRLETVTNVLNNSDIATNQIGRAIKLPTVNRIEDALEKPKPIGAINASSVIKPTGLLSTIINTVENNGTTTLLSTDVYGTYIDGLYAKVLESTSSIVTPNITPSAVVTESLYPTGVVSINQGKIVDAEGVSTLLYTTKALGTYIDDVYTTVTESASSLAVDEEKKAALPTDLPIAHRTGLVRLIEGSIIANDTTTFYESKVLGTVIDGRYAQIIESTSSFLSSPKASVSPSGVSDISPSATVAPDGKIASTAAISPSPVAIEGSISDTVKDDAESSTEESEEDDEKDGGRSKSRLTFQSRKRTFTPAIRPFASRQRPTFAPKRKQSGQSTAATITRSDFTPTVTAVPASRPNRFGARRSSSTPAGIQPTASGGRRFSRPKSSSAGGRRASSARIQPTSSGFGGSSRRGGFRTSSAGGPGIRPSSLFPARPRIRPTASLGLNRATSSQVTQSSIDDQNDLTTVVTDEVDTSAEDSETTLTLQTTTEATSRRSQNPLLKFRRPPLRPTSATRTRAATKKPASTTTTTARPRVTRPPSSLLNRPRPNALFPRRGLFTTTTQAPPPEEEEVEVVEEGENEEDLDEEGDAEEDTDYDSSLTNTQTAKPPPKPKAGVSIRPFARRRSRRDTYSRFKRPTSRTTTAAPLEERDEITEASRFSSRGRFYPKRGNYKSSSTTTTTTSAPVQSGRKRISPSKPLSQGRTQFTLRNSKEKLSMTTKRTNARTSRPTTASRQKTARGRYQTENTNSRSRQTSRTTNRGRGAQRQRYNKDDVDTSFSLPKFDGTITVTHHVPTEVTIPVVNGKVTEYKNVVSAKYSTEVLDKSQYTTSINPLGKEVKVLVIEKSELDGNGATLITQFVLNETPTTTVLYTPTVINRRKTSFSHVVPSTKYDVEEVVTTIQPALAAQAPLANILLSQLLLGGLSPQPNALLGIPPGGYVVPTPTTELKTKTTTYVTTVTNEMSTVIPLTFRGKEILTTLISSSVSVITATEYLTETVTVTPAFPVTPQFNTALLLPLLQQQLQQQQQQQQNQQQQSASQLLQAQQPADVFNLNTEPIQQQSLEENENLALEESQELVEQQATEAPKRRPAKMNKKAKPAPVEPPKETSVVTLYVSGRTPGEFTTLLSTVTVGEEEKRSKREVPVTPSQLPSQLTVEGLDDYIMRASEVHLEASELTKETESLESIIGDVSKHVATHTPELFNIKPTKSAKASKKYKIKVSDLSKVAPLVPKVETSHTHWGTSDTINSYNVSNNIGNSTNQLTRSRTKRDASEPARRRVVKKLIGVRPIQNASSEFYDTNNHLGSSNARRVPRRRLKIKKKKKRLLSNNVTLSDELQHPYKLSDPDFDEEHVQQATKPRRKVVITRKRILPNSSKLNSFLIASEPQVSSISATPTTEVLQSTVESLNEDKDVTEENLVESVETTTIEDDDEDSTEEAEYDDDYYDDEEYTTTEAVTEETTVVSEENLIPSTEDYVDDADEKPTFQDIPEYEPSFPELTESLDSPLLSLTTTVLSSVDFVTSTVTESRLRTYTFVVTRVSGSEQIITSTTEVRPQVKTTVLTEPVTKYTTLTLLDLDDRTDILSSTLDIPPSLLLDQVADWMLLENICLMLIKIKCMDFLFSWALENENLIALVVK
nr:unnamed protein product [Callosobruchus chinensis]